MWIMPQYAVKNIAVLKFCASFTKELLRRLKRRRKAYSTCPQMYLLFLCFPDVPRSLLVFLYCLETFLCPQSRSTGNILLDIILHLRRLWFPLNSWRILSLGWEFWLDVFSLSTWKTCCPFPRIQTSNPLSSELPSPSRQGCVSEFPNGCVCSVLSLD